ncbi:transposase [Ferruginibacter sp.]
MYLIQDEFYHVYNRGNQQKPIFFNQNNYLFFIKKIRDQLLPCADIICYCLMPNHFHLLIKANERSIKERISFGGKPMQEFAYRTGILLSSYSQAINKQQKTTGSLFQQKTKAKILSETVRGKKQSYLENCFFYIHNNPVAASLVKELADWSYSSYPDYVGIRNGSLCNKEIFLNLVDLELTDIKRRLLENVSAQIIERLY